MDAHATHLSECVQHLFDLIRCSAAAGPVCAPSESCQSVGVKEAHVDEKLEGRECQGDPLRRHSSCPGILIFVSLVGRLLHQSGALK